jgi:hypothetical protein
MDLTETSSQVRGPLVHLTLKIIFTYDFIGIFLEIIVLHLKDY